MALISQKSKLPGQKIARFLSQLLAWVKTHDLMEKGIERKLLERECLNRLSTDKEGGGLRGHTTVEHSRWEGMLSKIMGRR